MTVFTAMIEPIADHEHIRNRKTNVVGALQTIRNPTRGFIKQNARTQKGTFQHLAHRLQRTAGIENIVDHQYRLPA